MEKRNDRYVHMALVSDRTMIRRNNSAEYSSGLHGGIIFRLKKLFRQKCRNSCISAEISLFGRNALLSAETILFLPKLLLSFKHYYYSTISLLSQGFPVPLWKYLTWRKFLNPKIKCTWSLIAECETTCILFCFQYSHLIYFALHVSNCI